MLCFAEVSLFLLVPKEAKAKVFQEGKKPKDFSERSASREAEMKYKRIRRFMF